MTPQTYHYLHLLGLILLFSGLGSLLTRYNKVGMALHGTGLLVLLITGFGNAAKMGYGFPGWIIAKLIVWLLLGAMVVVIKRKLIPAPAAWAITIILGFSAAYFGYFKPF